MMLDEASLRKELQLKATRSSGSGGQHVNKVSTKVELHFNIEQSNHLDQEQKEILLNKLRTRITKEGTLILSSGKTRSQLKNKNLVVARFFELLYNSLGPKIERKPTKTPKHIKIKRLKQKRQQAEKKANRKPPELPNK